MASNSLPSLKTPITSTPTTPSTTDRHQPSNAVSHQQGSAPDDDNDSGNEWGVDLGNLIIDLDADLQKDEMKKNDARNSNNNNSIKGSATNGPANGANSEAVLNPSAKIDSSNPAKGSKPVTSVAGSNSSQAASKTKSKSKKTSKSNMTKHGGAPSVTTSTSTTPGRSEFSLGDEGPIPTPCGNRVLKPETPSSKPGRNYKKQSKGNSASDKKNELSGTSKDGREKSNKSGKGSKNNVNQSNSNMMSVANSIYSVAGAVTSVEASSVAANKGKQRVNSPCLSKTAPTIGIHSSSATGKVFAENATSVSAAGDGGGQFCKTIPTQVNEAPVMASTAHLGKHRKTSSMPSPMKYQSTLGISSSQSPIIASAVNDTGTVHSSIGKRERLSLHGSLQTPGNKKIKLEKESKPYASGMTPNDGEGIPKWNTVSIGLSLPGHLSNLKQDYKMTVGQQKISSNDAKGDKKSNSRLSSSGQHGGKNAKNSSNGSGMATTLAEEGSVSTPQNEVPTPEEQKRTVGTVTTYADIGISTEPESLGPCEPGTSVHLNGIVWHETESGVLVVNVTWRNRSYVGTLLDATKHDWAPPRIPDADSDAEYRVKSGRPKRQRGANGNGTDGRKGRKSMANNVDEYKCSPSATKRRSAKMSESDACSGNDGEICTTPSKSAKRARLSRTATAKQAAQKAANAAAVKESSGDGTSGSGSSACSSPVFMECPYANCKRKYKDDNALKYHEAHAHQGEDIEDVEKTAQDDQDSNAADSPKECDNTSTKSNEEIAVSDSTGSPNEGDNETVPEPKSNHTAAMETDVPTPSAAQTPFVVTQPQVQHGDQYQSGGYPSQNQDAPMQSNFAKRKQINETKRTQNEYPADVSTSMESNSSVSRSDESIPADGAVSPYTLTDSQSNDSISLKVHLQTKPQRPYHTSRPTTAYTDSAPMTSHDRAALEHASAVDNESAQAVQTLLQLQENIQDQLPGLTPYSQTSQSTSLPMPSQIVPTSASTAPSQSNSTLSPNESVEKNVPETHAKPQQVPNSVAPQFKGHSKDGTPLPRMSVGVASSPRHAGSSFTHGTVTSNSSQERSPHYTPTGLKTVKGKTVPIPTDPQQKLVTSSQPSVSNTLTGSNANLKKQKRKKPKSEPGRTPTDPIAKPTASISSGRLPTKDDTSKQGLPLHDQTRIKQEHHHVMQPGTVPHNRTQHDSRMHLSSANMQIHPSAGNVKLEPETKTPPGGALIPSRGSGYSHPSISRAQRPQIYPTTDALPREQISHMNATNKNNNNKLTPHGRVSDPCLTVPPHVSHAHHSSNPSFLDAQERTHRTPHSGVHGASHSLPGSRSLTPVNPSANPQPAQRQNAPQHVESAPTTPQAVPKQIRPSSKESVSPPPPLDSRRLSAEGVQKNTPGHGYPSVRTVYGYPLSMLPYEIGAYQAQFMNDPSFMQQFDKIIQQEIHKDQKPKDEQPIQSTSRPRSTPSPNPQPKHVRPKSPTRSEERRRESPPKVQVYSPHLGSQVQAGHRISHGVQHTHTPRASPVPHGAYPSTPSKPGSAAPGRGLSPHPQAAPSPMSGNRPPRPSSETERYHRREASLNDRQQSTSRTPTVTPARKISSKEGYPDHNPQSPDKTKSGPPPSSVHASPSARIPMQYYSGAFPATLFDPQSMRPFYAAAPQYMYHPGPHIFPGAWPHGTPPPAVSGGPEKVPSHSPYPGKPSRDRSSSGSRSPYREEVDRSRDGMRGRDGDSYSSSKERRSSDGPPQSRKSVTPDPKAPPPRNPTSDGNSGAVTPPPMQRHVHTHHHIHEGLPALLPPPQYQYQMAAASVMAGTEAALGQYPKRDLP